MQVPGSHPAPSSFFFLLFLILCTLSNIEINQITVCEANFSITVNWARGIDANAILSTYFGVNKFTLDNWVGDHRSGYIKKKILPRRLLESTLLSTRVRQRIFHYMSAMRIWTGDNETHIFLRAGAHTTQPSGLTES